MKNDRKKILHLRTHTEQLKTSHPLSRNLKLHISPCPNDTFIFDALLNGRIDSGELSFEVSFADIEQLNETAISGSAHADICKVSYAMLPQLTGCWRVLDSGGALGYGNGPLLVAARDVNPQDGSLRVAVPGEHTTAHCLLKRLFPSLTRTEFCLFSEIAPRVAAGDFDVGVLIHEGRFTYEKYGLHLIADLGQAWEETVGLPLPLGAIMVSAKLPEALQREINRLVRASVEYAFAHPAASADFVRAHAQELDPVVAAQHIRLFVNDYSLSLGSEGRRAIAELTGISDPHIFVGCE